MRWLDYFRLFRLLFGKSIPAPEQIERLGLMAVKIGQVFALRVDFLGQEKCAALARLYSRQTHAAPGSLERWIQRAGGESFLAHFLSFEATPLAVASIGQVHRACLTSGQEVVVKFVKGDLRSGFERDIARAGIFFRVAQWINPRLRGVANPLALLNELRAMTLNELALRNEIAGHQLLEQIREEESRRFNLEGLVFARVFPELSGESVLVKQFLPGGTFDELLDQGKISYATLLELFRVHGIYMFVRGIFHGDLHSGNVLLSEGRIAFIDTGFIGRVSDRIRVGLFRFFAGLVQADYVEAARQLHAMSGHALDPKQYLAFERKFLELYRDFSGKTVGEVSLTRKMMDTIRLGVLSGMDFDEGMFDIIKSLMYMDGMVLRANPEARLIEDLKPFIEEFKAYVL